MQSNYKREQRRTKAKKSERASANAQNEFPFSRANKWIRISVLRSSKAIQNMLCLCARTNEVSKRTIHTGEKRCRTKRNERKQQFSGRERKKCVTSVLQHTNLHKNGLFCPFSLDKYHRAHPPSNKSSTEIDSLHTNNPIFNARNRLKKLRGKVN